MRRLAVLRTERFRGRWRGASRTCESIRETYSDVYRPDEDTSLEIGCCRIGHEIVDLLAHVERDVIIPCDEPRTPSSLLRRHGHARRGCRQGWRSQALPVASSCSRHGVDAWV